MRRWSIGAVLVAGAAMTLGQSQCAVEPPAPPMDATGTYAGTWQGQNEDGTEEVSACALTVTLDQNPAAGFPGNHGVTGTVTINYDCFTLPDWLDTPPASEVQVSGIWADDGQLGLASGGCGTGMCVVLLLDGIGEDLDSDGYMDRYTGDWGYAILLAGVQPFGFEGTFAVDVVAP